MQQFYILFIVWKLIKVNFLSIVSCFHLLRTWKYWHLWSAKPHAKFSIHKIGFHGKSSITHFWPKFSITRLITSLGMKCNMQTNAKLCNFHNITWSKIARLVNEHLNTQRECIQFPINFNHRDPPKGLCSLSFGAPYLFTNLHLGLKWVGFEMSQNILFGGGWGRDSPTSCEHISFHVQLKCIL